MNKKELVVKYRPLVALACRIHNLRNLFRTRIKGKGNRIVAPCALLKKVKVRISGDNNTVVIGDFSTLHRASIHISGSGNTVMIGDWSTLVEAELHMEGSGNAISIGKGTRILGNTHLAALEGTKITLGEECLFSSGVHFRTGDSHSVLDGAGRRINPSRDITLGNHVWVGTRVTCLKGVKVADHSIIGACALVTGCFEKPHCALAGVPAKVVKENVDWTLRRIPVGEIAPEYLDKEEMGQ